MRTWLVSVLLVTCCVGSAAGEILLQHDFDDGTDGPFTPLGPGWSVVDGVYHCAVQGYESFSCSLAGDPYWTDYIISCDVKVEGAPDHVIRFRIHDFQDFYKVNVRSAPWNDVVVSRVDYLGQWDIGTAPFPSVAGIWHHLEIQVIGWEITVLFDDQVVIVCNDPDKPEELRMGKIGLLCFAGGAINWQDAWFDNVLVTDTTVKTAAVTWGGVKALFR